MKRSVIALVAIAAAAVPTAAAWAASDNAGGPGLRMELEGHISDVQQVDLGTPGESPGDLGVLTGTLTRKGEEAGNFQGVCVTVRGEDQSECSFTLALPEGQLSIRGGYGPGINGADTVLESVVGGTGHYGFVRGYDVGEETDDGFRMELHLKL